MIARRCLICANLNPCKQHSNAAQWEELRRNDAEIARIKAKQKDPTHDQ